jgi:hypothetical protein
MLRSALYKRVFALTFVWCAALAACTSGSSGSGAAPIADGSGGASGAGGTSGAGGASGAGGQAGVGQGGNGSAGMQSASDAGTAGQAGASAGTSAGAGGAAEPIEDASTPDANADEGVTSEAGVIVPTAEWACDLPGGIPAPEDGTLVAEIEIDLQAPLELGETQFGDRTILLTESGSATGELEASVLEGGYDWELTLPSGARELETRHVLRTSNGTLIYMRGCGVGTPGGATRVIMEVEVGSAFAAFRSGIHVATRELSEGHARFALYRFAEGVTPDGAAPKFAIQRTAADRAQKPHPWQCVPPPGGSSGGAQLLEATVGIGGSLAVGATQNGSRNIIPITGGTFEGLGTAAGLDGEVIPGGADFQLTPPGESFQLEARYTLRAEDGTLIAVRNCGGVGGTAPYFEAPLASPYAYLNDGDYFGRIGISIGAVIISVFERMP